MILCTMSNANNKRPSNIRKENKDKDDAVGSKFSWMEDGKSLSKNLLYTPLVAYHKAAAAAAAAAASAAASVDDNDNDDVNKRSNQHHPSQYMSMKSSVPKSLQEVSLVAFLHTVSCDYHRNGNNRGRSTTGFGGGVSNNDAKNNGSRPLGKNDIEGRIRQRAVTLIGGGINSSIIPTNKTFQERTSLSSNNNKKRRQRSWEEIKPILLNKMNMKKNNQNNDSNDVISFLQALNVAWNEYIWKVISNPPSSSNKKPKNDNTKNNNDEAQLQNLDIPSLKEIEYQFIALTRINNNNNNNKINNNNNNGSKNNDSSTNNNYRPIELIGSHVRIESCNSHRSWIGRFGILIGETTNTYRISGYSSTTKRGRRKKTKTKRTKRVHTKVSSDVISSSTTNTSDVVKEEHEDNYDELEIFLLPKRGSSMVLIVPVPSDTTTTTTTTSSSCVNNNNNNNKDGRDDNKNIISLPDKAICISIIDPDDIIK